MPSTPTLPWTGTPAIGSGGSEAHLTWPWMCPGMGHLSYLSGQSIPVSHPTNCNFFFFISSLFLPCLVSNHYPCPSATDPTKKILASIAFQISWWVFWHEGISS